MHPRRFFLLAALMAAVLLPATFAAQPQPKHSASPAEAVVPAYMGAIRVGDWQKAGHLLHPEALAEMRQVFVALTSADPTGQAAKQLFNLADGETLETLPPSDVFARFMSALVSQTDGLKDLLASTQVETLGAVSESGGLSHVVYRLTRTTAGQPPTIQVEVLTVKKAGAEWRSMVPPDIAGILASIRSSLAQRDSMMQQMQQQQQQPGDAFPQLDLTTAPPTP
ncbi:MAG TPA: hypothetical protein VFV75_07475 [Candidatus Polarisedimenticolaceae bacterium]|nr:hypothetical protein [Candidatus Polarisedimenticolaceae bacterium]